MKNIQLYCFELGLRYPESIQLKLKIIIIVIFKFILTAQIVILPIFSWANGDFAQTQCQVDSESLREFWRNEQGETDVFQLFRANAFHYWKFTRLLFDNCHMSTSWRFSGWGIGDFHPLNLGDVEVYSSNVLSRERIFTVVDFDDGGSDVPFLPDLSRGFVANALLPSPLNREELWGYYLSGLHGDLGEVENFENLMNIQRQPKSVFYDKQRKYKRKLLIDIGGQGDYQFSEESGVISINNAAIEVQKIYHESHQEFEKIVSSAVPGAIIKGVGFKVKETGGSAGVARFWYIVKGRDLNIPEKENKNQNVEHLDEVHILEFKMQVTPAVQTFKNQQLSNDERLEKLIKFYRSSFNGEIIGILYPVKVGQYTFLLRERFKSLLKIDYDKETKREGLKSEDVLLAQEWLKYTFWLMGSWHRQQVAVGGGIVPERQNYQLENYISIIDVNRAKVFDELNIFVDSYLKIFKR